MNLFILSTDPIKAAQAHCDKHVIKMILETCQMLYTAHWTAAYPDLLTKTKKQLGPLTLPPSLQTSPKKINSESRGYKYAHLKHPCTIWIRASLENYHFACDLGLALGEEYTYRWQKPKPHACLEHIKWLKANPPAVAATGQTPFAIAMDDKYKTSSDPIECYRNYYLTAKKEKGLLVYTRRPEPDFITPSTPPPASQ